MEEIAVFPVGDVTNVSSIYLLVKVDGETTFPELSDAADEISEIVDDGSDGALVWILDSVSEATRVVVDEPAAGGAVDDVKSSVKVLVLLPMI